MTPLIETCDLNVRFGGVHATRDVNFTLAEAELRCVIGPNGAGKSTFFKLLTGQVKPTSGKIFFRGKDISNMQPHEPGRLGIGIKTQVPSLFNGLTVWENVWLSARRVNSNQQADRITRETLERVGMTAYQDSLAGLLAHGMRQWVEIGVVIAADPPLAGVRVDTTVPLTAGACDDWRGALRADFSDPMRLRFTGSYPAACAEKVWATAYADPERYNARALLGMWKDMSGRIGGTVRDGVAPVAATTPPTFEVPSPTLAEVIRDINKYSNNVMAQQLFLTLGLTQRGAGTPDAAREVVRQWSQERLGASVAALVIDNGSGLSRESRVSAQLLARLLLAAWASPVMPELMASLPVAGIDGTLKRSRATLGRAHLKTGSLRDVAGIAGYVLANSGRRYVVVAIANHANANAARPAFDELVQWTANDAPVAGTPPVPPEPRN